MTKNKDDSSHLDENLEKEQTELSSVSEEQSEESAFDSAAHNPKQVMITDIELKNMQKELIEYKDKYLRLLADNENTRKRMQKERQETAKYAVEGIIIDFLHPLDNLENALKFAQEMSDEIKHWALGFQMILTQFKDILTENGVQPIESIGQQFDPHKHEAVEMVEDLKKDPGTIMTEYMRGYEMNGRTIRPARVKVSKSVETESIPSSPDATDKQEEE